VSSHSIPSLLGQFHDAEVVVLGDVMLDRFVYGKVDRISPEAPIPVMHIERSVDMPGGAGNVARNIAALGGKATLIGAVGSDSSARDLRNQLEKVPSIEARLIIDLSRPTTLKTRYVAERQQVLRVDAESRAALGTEYVQRVLTEFRKALSTADIVVLSDYDKGVLSNEVTREVLSAARQAGTPVLVDPKGQGFAKYAGATLLTPNLHELQVATGMECASDEQTVLAARRILDQGLCECLVVTRGKDGMTIVQKNGDVRHLRTLAREVYDVSGAGDTVVATLALGLAAGGALFDAASLANTAAGISVSKPGTAVVTTGELLASINQSSGRADSGKIFALSRGVELVRSWRDEGLKVAFTNGCFDLLHPGHIALLEQARRTADRLVVGLNDDLSVRRLKGEGRPVQGEVARATVLASLKPVDAVVIFSEDTPLDLITAIEPDVLVKGADYALQDVVGADVVTARGGTVVLAELVEGHSTTRMVDRMAATAGK
jgi:D-beta-D-heptose 7-phosphate kinase / D-beta-D-heptose 1-phosphate adenosyltransferase